LKGTEYGRSEKSTVLQRILMLLYIAKKVYEYIYCREEHGKKFSKNFLKNFKKPIDKAICCCYNLFVIILNKERL
ncbi:MAG: hypothetical protein J6S10_00715, partial [Clostridia bacterium]|nr:hypothetical protein [Clostridia bacterium]